MFPKKKRGKLFGGQTWRVLGGVQAPDWPGGGQAAPVGRGCFIWTRPGRKAESLFCFRLAGRVHASKQAGAWCGVELALLRVHVA